MPKYEDVLEMKLSISSTVSRFQPLYDGQELQLWLSGPQNRNGSGKYELRPAVKKFFQLRPKVSVSRVSVTEVTSGIVNASYKELQVCVW